MKIKVAFYKGGEGWQHKIIRWWTKSIYSHAELVMPDNFTWISISPFLESKVAKRLKTDFDLEKWDFISIDITEEQHSSILEFYENTKDNVYDWWGMLLSQFTPFKVKSKNKWYCSEWITNALVSNEPFKSFVASYVVPFTVQEPPQDKLVEIVAPATV